MAFSLKQCIETSKRGALQFPWGYSLQNLEPMYFQNTAFPLAT